MLRQNGHYTRDRLMQFPTRMVSGCCVTRTKTKLRNMPISAHTNSTIMHQHISQPSYTTTTHSPYNPPHPPHVTPGQSPPPPAAPAGLFGAAVRARRFRPRQSPGAATRRTSRQTRQGGQGREHRELREGKQVEAGVGYIYARGGAGDAAVGPFSCCVRGRLAVVCVYYLNN